MPETPLITGLTQEQLALITAPSDEDDLGQLSPEEVEAAFQVDRVWQSAIQTLQAVVQVRRQTRQSPEFE